MNGEHLRERLAKQSMPLADIARSMGLSPQSLENRLKAKDVKINFIVELSKAINKSVYFLIKGSDAEEAFMKSDNSIVYENDKDNDLDIVKEIKRINDKLENFECFIEAIKMKIEIEEEMKKAMINLKKTHSKDS